MSTKKHFQVVVSTKAKALHFSAFSVELDTPTGQLVILPGHIPVIGLVSKTGSVTIKDTSDATTVLSMPGALFVLDSLSSMTVVKTD